MLKCNVSVYFLFQRKRRITRDMNSLSEIWDSVVAQLSTSLTPTAINTWFSEVTPIALNDNKLVIHTPTDFKRNIIVQRFANTIK